MSTTAATATEGLLRPQSLAESIAVLLQRDIIAGAFRPGHRLVERELTARFGVSSIPVREALRELENRGLVVRRHNRGCSVVQLTRNELSRIAELRYTLEPQVARWAAERITADGIRRLQAHLDRMKASASEGDLATFFHEDLAFHRTIWDAADNPFASRALESVLGSLFASGMMGQPGRSIDLALEIRKHQRLLRAIVRHDPAGAADALREIASGFELHLPEDAGGAAGAAARQPRAPLRSVTRSKRRL